MGNEISTGNNIPQLLRQFLLIIFLFLGVVWLILTVNLTFVLCRSLVFQRKDVKIIRTVESFNALIETLVREPAEREQFYKVSHTVVSLQAVDAGLQ